MEQQIKGYVLSSKILKEVLEGLIKESNFGHAVYIVEICKSFAGASQWKGGGGRGFIDNDQTLKQVSKYLVTVLSDP